MDDEVAGVRPGEVVALVAPNEPIWLRGYRALLDRGAIPLLLDVSAPELERERWLALAGGSRTLTADQDGTLRLTGDRLAASRSSADGEPAVLLCTSGSTGVPKVARRSLASLDAEGRRYVAWARLTDADRLAVPIPMWHAYALGWVHAALAVGCPIEPSPAWALGRGLRTVADGATLLIVVPAIASVLAGRAARNRQTYPALRLAMAGAGPVTLDLDDRFRAAFGVGLARNYGSTETGALFAAPADVPPGLVGGPMPGVRYRVIGHDGQPVPDGERGSLEVNVDESGWHPMGDLVVMSEEGLRVVGRRSRAIRRGDRWVAPEEIEQVLQSHPVVVDARCRDRAGAGRSTVLEAQVVGTSGVRTDTVRLRSFLSERLASYKIPERIRLVNDLRRGPSGKLTAERPLRLSGAGSLVAAANAYKTSELLFTLVRLGALDALAGGAATPAELIERLDLDEDAGEALLSAATDLGLLEEATDPGGDSGRETDGEELRALLDLEDRLSRTFVTREELVAVALGGPQPKPPDDDFADLYHRAMHPPAAYRRARMGLRLAGADTGVRLLEVTCGPGRYIGEAEDRACLPIGLPAGNGEPREARLPEADETFDVVVLSNAVHLSTGGDLDQWAQRLRPGGRLLVDDVFLDEKNGISAAVRLDWLTHGGLDWPTVASLRTGLHRVGLAIQRVVSIGEPAATLVLAGQDGAEAGDR